MLTPPLETTERERAYEDFMELYVQTLFAMWRQLKDHHAPLGQYLEFEAFTRLIYRHS